MSVKDSGVLSVWEKMGILSILLSVFQVHTLPKLYFFGLVGDSACFLIHILVVTFAITTLTKIAH